MKLINNKLFFIFIFVIFTSVGFAQNVENENDLLKISQKFLQAGEFEKAVIELDRVLKINPKNVSAFYLRGFAKFFK